MVWAPPLVTESFVPTTDTELLAPQDLLDCLYKQNLTAWDNMIEFVFSPLYLNCVSFKMTERLVLVLLLNFARRMLWYYCFFALIRMSYSDFMFFCVTCQIGEFC